MFFSLLDISQKNDCVCTNNEINLWTKRILLRYDDGCFCVRTKNTRAHTIIAFIFLALCVNIRTEHRHTWLKLPSFLFEMIWHVTVTSNSKKIPKNSIYQFYLYCTHVSFRPIVRVFLLIFLDTMFDECVRVFFLSSFSLLCFPFLLCEEVWFVYIFLVWAFVFVHHVGCAVLVIFCVYFSLPSFFV